MPTAYRVTITPEASLKLDEIYAFVAPQSLQNAERVVERLVDEMFSLKALPQRYKVYKPAKSRRGEVVRSMPAPPFAPYYSIDERRRVVRVLTVLHGSQRRPRGTI